MAAQLIARRALLNTCWDAVLRAVGPSHLGVGPCETKVCGDHRRSPGWPCWGRALAAVACFAVAGRCAT